MKMGVNIVRIIVGVLFIISGLVKANDPLGLSYKMQEFFEVWHSDLSHAGFLKNILLSLLTFSNAHSLLLSVIMITLEIFAGLALLLGWKKNFILWLLFALIVFFTFLTGYAYYSGKFKNCGCFGDCLPITPFTSFMKDVILTAMILFLLAGKRFIQPIITSKKMAASLALALAAVIGFQVYVLQYLPVVDCLPFKKGADIQAGMKPPPGSVPDSFAINFIYTKGGKQYEFAPETLPADLDQYTYVDRKDVLVRKGNADPAIKGFSMVGSDVDSTEIILNQPAAILYFYDGMEAEVFENIMQVKQAAAAKNIPVYVLAPSLNAFQKMKKSDKEGLQFFAVDFTIFRTAARTNPCIYILHKGIVQEKRSKHEVSKIIDAMAASNISAQS